MQLINKRYKIGKIENITVEKIESIIRKDGLNPLRWAIVKTEAEHFIVEAVVIKD